MANNESATPITTGTQTGNKIKERGIYYFRLPEDKFFYTDDADSGRNDTQRLCGLTGIEIDSNFHFLSGNDIKDVEFNYSAGTVVITRVNDEFEPIVLDLKGTHPQPENFVYSAETGELFLIYPDGTELKADGFFIDEGKYDLKNYTDGTINGLGTQYNPLSLSRLERTGTFAPVETLVEDGDIEQYKGRRILTKELIDDYGHLYSYEEVEAIQAALENSPWRVATKADWDELLNAMELEEVDRNHDDCRVDRREQFHGMGAGDMLKSVYHWDTNGATNVSTEEHEYNGFGVLPVGVRPYRANLITDEENDIEGFGELSAFWTLRSSADTCGEGNPFIKIFSNGFGGVAQKRPDEDDAYSIRLVRECEPGCPEQYETILGSTYPVGPITSPCGVDYCKIWTLSNFYSKGRNFSGSVISGASVPAPTEYAYFINECDGSKKRMMEGESIVILDRTQNPNLHEWRIIDGELVDTYKEVDDAIKALSGDLITHIDEFSAGTVSELDILSEALEALSIKTTEVDNIISGGVRSVNEKVSQSNSALTNSISLLSAETYNAINNLQANLNNEVERLDGRIDELTEASATKEALSAETARATSVESQLADSLLATNDLLGELSATVQTQNSENTNEIQNVASKANDNASKLSTLSSSTVVLSETLNDTITELYGIQEQLENGIGDASGATLEEAKAYTDEQIEAVNAVKVNDLYFDNLSKYIKLVKADGSLTDGIPAEDFLKDSVLTRVEYDEGNERLVFVWNDDDTTRTYIPLAKLSNVYGVGQDSLAFLKMSGTNLSAIVDKADGFEKTLASTKYVDDVASAMTAVIGELVEANNENREDIDRLNGDKSVAGSVEHTVDDKFNTALLTAGLPVTTVTVDDARNHSLIRTIIVNGETKYFVSNNAKDMLAEDKDGYTLSLNRYINNLENKIAALENENSLLKTRVAILERRVDDIAATGIDETMVRNIVKGMFVGTDREIKVSETGELGQKLQIGFADDAIFGDYLAN